MKYALILLAIPLLYACWHPVHDPDLHPPSLKKVWGNRPIYTTEVSAKQIQYETGSKPIRQAGNIYALGNYIFQVDVGRGIHVINNSVPANASRIGFISVNGCSQISIKGKYLYTNSLNDLVTLDLSDPVHLKEVSRVKNAFPEFLYSYQLAQPEDTGFYTCPRYDSIVIGWVKDSIYTSCYKN